ncbi:MAG: hypothetical protein WD850_03410 [Candidatus Spechtbacterales bacterium]
MSTMEDQFKQELHEKEQPTKNERRELKRQQKREEREQAARGKAIKKAVTTAAVVAGIIVVGAWAVNALPSSPSADIPQEDIASQSGIHWHPELKIVVRGEEVTIPANVGIGSAYKDDPLYDSRMGMAPIHTHDASGTLHWEVARGPVAKRDVTVGRFFEVWDATFTSTCILDACNSDDGTIKMLVNGEENGEFENYQVNDGDKIEIRYE